MSPCGIPFVLSKLGPDYKTAALTLSAEVRNSADHPVTALVQAEVAGEELQQSVELAASETKIVRFSPDQFAQLMLAHPRLWWPYQMGEHTSTRRNSRGNRQGDFR